MNIRAMLPADYDAVFALWTATAGMSNLETWEQFIFFLQRNPGLSQVALVEEVIVGAVLCGHDGRRGYLYHLAVADSHRRRGIAESLVTVCLDELARLGISRCSIHIYTTNVPGEDFWRRIGWRERSDLHVFAMDIVPSPTGH